MGDGALRLIISPETLMTGPIRVVIIRVRHLGGQPHRWLEGAPASP